MKFSDKVQCSKVRRQKIFSFIIVFSSKHAEKGKHRFVSMCSQNAFLLLLPGALALRISKSFLLGPGIEPKWRYLQ